MEEIKKNLQGAFTERGTAQRETNKSSNECRCTPPLNIRSRAPFYLSSSSSYLAIHFGYSSSNDRNYCFPNPLNFIVNSLQNHAYLSNANNLLKTGSRATGSRATGSRATGSRAMGSRAMDC